MHYYRPCEPQQEMLRFASLQDWLPKGQLAYFIGDTVDAPNLKAFCAWCGRGGARNPPLHPARRVKVPVFAYPTGVFISRKVERRRHDDLAFRMLGAGNFPEHRTIPDFRAMQLLALSNLFVQEVKRGTVAIDGTKTSANAGRHKATGYGLRATGYGLRATGTLRRPRPNSRRRSTRF